MAKATHWGYPTDPKDTRTNGLEFSGVLDYGKTYLFSSKSNSSQGIGPFTESVLSEWST